LLIPSQIAPQDSFECSLELLVGSGIAERIDWRIHVAEVIADGVERLEAYWLGEY
jgi:hypothetical protein